MTKWTGWLEIILKAFIYLAIYLHSDAESITFAMFFMVLDLRLVKIGCRETINFFYYLCLKSSIIIVEKHSRVVKMLKSNVLFYYIVWHKLKVALTLQKEPL